MPATRPVIADVAVIGAGCAGLSAAVRLAEAGMTVVVLEEAPRLGGRATAFADRDTGERVDNGQHVLFGCYRETFAFLERIGSAALAPIQPRLALTMIGQDGRPSALVCPAWPPPWHLVGGVMRWRALSIRDRLSAGRLVGMLRAVKRDGAEAVAARVRDDQTVSDWLAANGQTARLCEWLWRPLAIAALNQSPDVAAAPPFVRVLGELFGPRVEDSAVALPRVPLDELYAAPAVRFLESHCGAVMVKSSARIELDAGGAVVGVHAGDTRIQSRRVISSVPWHALGRIWHGGVPAVLGTLVSDAARMGSVPIVTVNLWFDRPVLHEPFVGLIGCAMHWAFDKSAIFGNGAGHISMVSSGAGDLARADNAALTDLAVRELSRACPEGQSARLLRSVVVREPRATFSLAPGGPARPGAATAVPGFFLAGDWTNTGLPATIEGAVKSGHTAADLVATDIAAAVRPR